MRKPRESKVVRCVACLSALGWGIKRIVRQTGYAKTTITRFRQAHRLTDPFLADIRKDAFNALSNGWTKSEMERAWAMEWRGVGYIGELKHWANIPEEKAIRFPFCAQAWRRTNKGNIRQLKKAWLKTETGRAYLTNERKKPTNRIRNNLRKRVRDYVKQHGARTIDLIGCSTLQLRAHIEFLFEPGMTWENYGQWHVDHIRPCAAFDLTDRAQRCACFHWSNLQPLWALENIAKSDSLTWKKAA